MGLRPMPRWGYGGLPPLGYPRYEREPIIIPTMNPYKKYKHLSRLVVDGGDWFTTVTSLAMGIAFGISSSIMYNNILIQCLYLVK